MAFRGKDFEGVDKIASQIPRDAREWQAGQLLLGEAAVKVGRENDAIRHYLAAAQDTSTEDGHLALFSAAEVHFELGQLTEAEKLYRDLLTFRPQNGITNSRLAFLLAMTNRRWEALDHFYVLIKGGDADYRELGMAADVARQIRQPDFLEKCQRLNPGDNLVRLALATDAFSEGYPEARPLLQALVESHPELISAQAMLGELLTEASIADAGFIAWHQSLPADADESPDVWFVRGLWARKQHDLKTAAACFSQTVIRMPFHRRGFYALGQVLAALGDPRAQSVSEYASLMLRVSQQVDKVLQSNGKNGDAVRRVAELMESLGRIWEACAWAVVGRSQDPREKWHKAIFDRHAHKLTPLLPQIEAHKNPVANFPLEAVPDFSRFVAEVSMQLDDGQLQNGGIASSIHFDEADVIQFQYHNGDDPMTKGVRPFEQTGGGVAIIDFDLDGNPDVFLPQGGEWNTGSNAPTITGRFTDKLFRNRDGQQFSDATSNLIGRDESYGQGCAVGDYNNDGFPDLYVANIGHNCLYENMGDGTFADVTDSVFETSDLWTASAVICDLNADSLPDIFDVNYLSGQDVYTKICRHRACSPSVFPGAADRLMINLGDGGFGKVRDGTPTADSKGLGVVVFESNDKCRPSLFVANDQVANFLLHSQPANNRHNIVMSNEAVATGLAFNDHGLPMASMGIAVEDLDGNGLPDLFTTNFQDESNTLYLQDSPDLYTEATKALNLQAASVPYTGWGTQALDADLDGWPDLVVANGHVDDGREYGGDYHQRPQFFHNQGGGFKELNADSAGQWFAGKYLGRGLARVDWNLDGLPEFIVSNINAPVSVLENSSIGAGHFLRVKLHATQTARDAIGARATVVFSGHEVTRQLFAGDGYMASNERVIEFGLGNSTDIDALRVHWPSGAMSEMVNPEIDTTMIVVEGVSAGTQIRQGRLKSRPVTVTEESP